MAKKKKGFASMTDRKQREIASKGGQAAHKSGHAHEWTSEEARKAGKKGGQRHSKKDIGNSASSKGSVAYASRKAGQEDMYDIEELDDMSG